MSERNPLIYPKAGDVVVRALSTTPITVRTAGNQVEYYFGTGSEKYAHLRAMSLDSWREWLQGGSVVKRAEES